MKNVEFTELGDKLGRVHMERQDFGQLQTRKVKALKRRAGERAPAVVEAAQDAAAGLGSDLED